MIEFWQECASYLATSQRLADQVRTIIKKGWFSDFELLEIRKKTNNEEDTYTVSNTLCLDKHEQSNQNELPTLENRNITTPISREQTLTQE